MFSVPLLLTQTPTRPPVFKTTVVFSFIPGGFRVIGQGGLAFHRKEALPFSSLPQTAAS